MPAQGLTCSWLSKKAATARVLPLPLLPLLPPLPLLLLLL